MVFFNFLARGVRLLHPDYNQNEIRFATLNWVWCGVTFCFKNPDSAVTKTNHLRKLTNSGIVCWGRYPYLSLPLPILLYVPFISGSVNFLKPSYSRLLSSRKAGHHYTSLRWMETSKLGGQRWKSSTWEISNFLPFEGVELIFIDLAAEKGATTTEIG